MIATEWMPIPATDLIAGQQVRQGAHTMIGQVAGWRYRPERKETVVDVIYAGDIRTQWVVPDGDTVLVMRTH